MEREFIPKYKNKTDDTATTQKQHSKKKREQLAKHEHHNNNTNNNSIEQMGEAAKDIISLITNGRDGDAIINDWTLLDEKNGGPNNNQGYFIATQDENLANLLRNMPNVPLFRLSRGVLLLERCVFFNIVHFFYACPFFSSFLLPICIYYTDVNTLKYNNNTKNDNTIIYYNNIRTKTQQQQHHNIYI